MSASLHQKKPKVNKTIGTHDGKFHCDDALACSMLKLLPEYEDAEIIRSRDQDVLDSCDVVVDVGGVYKPESQRFDHHQKSFDLSMNSLDTSKKWTVRLSSAGLVYHHYGRRIIAKLLDTKPSDSLAEIIYDKVYENFILEIDAIDNGIDICDGEKRYEINTNLSSRIAFLNPAWNEVEVDSMVRFHDAINLTQKEFLDCIRLYQSQWLPAREIVLYSAIDRYEIDASGEIIVLKELCPWKDHLLTLEEDGVIQPPLIKFVIYMDVSGSWRVQCVPAGRGTFGNRLSLPKAWRGLRLDELSSKCGIKGCTFVHATGFIGGNNSYEGALEMARSALCLARNIASDVSE